MNALHHTERAAQRVALALAVQLTEHVVGLGRLRQHEIHVVRVILRRHPLAQILGHARIGLRISSGRIVRSRDPRRDAPGLLRFGLCRGDRLSALALIHGVEARLERHRLMRRDGDVGPKAALVERPVRVDRAGPRRARRGLVRKILLLRRDGILG